MTTAKRVFEVRFTQISDAQVYVEADTEEEAEQLAWTTVDAAKWVTHGCEVDFINELDRDDAIIEGWIEPNPEEDEELCDDEDELEDAAQ